MCQNCARGCGKTLQIINLLFSAVFIGMADVVERGFIGFANSNGIDRMTEDGDNVVEFHKLPEMQPVTLKVLRWEERDKIQDCKLIMCARFRAKGRAKNAKSED
jgi:hypothetical protein